MDKYIQFANGSMPYFSELYWPFASSQNPFRELVDNGTGVAVVTVLSVDKVYRHDIYVYVVYKARIERVIVEPQNTIELPPQEVCMKDPTICDSARREHDIIENWLSMIRENNTIELLVPAFLPMDSINKTNLTICDVASPFPLLEPRHQYLVFLEPELDGIHIHYDYVWGPWAYLILDNKLYSLDHIEPPSNISLDPIIMFNSPQIDWKPYPYQQLREIAMQKLSINGEPLTDFISNKIGS
ncbi:MAG: hypothetical protein F7C36_01055 [Desulfurococcales archaeon]|nr:hypothetical protein [Desulfurococcales archaeon]